jgi:hypothetical protein
LMQGRSVPYGQDRNGLIRLYARNQEFIGLAEAASGQLIPRRLHNTQA